MRTSNLLIVLLALGTVGGFASGFRSVARHHYYKHHGGYSRECGRRPPTPTVVERIVERRHLPPTNNNPTVNIYVNGQPQQQAQPPVVNTQNGDTQPR